MVFRGVSVLCAVICIVLFLMIGGEKEQLAADLETAQLSLQGAELEMERSEERITEQRSRLTTLDSELGAEKNRSATLYQQNVQARKEIKNMRTEIEMMTDTLSTLEEDKNRLNRELLQVKAEAGSMDPAKEAEYSSKITALEAEVNLLKTQLRQAGQSALTEVTGDIVPDVGEQPAISGQTFRGKILSVNRDATVVAVNLGRNQGADNGSQIDIIKDNSLLATLEVSTSQENASICRVMPGSPNARDLIKLDDVILVLKR